MKEILASICICFLFLAIVQLGVAQEAELPTWNVGDVWAMGARDVDLAPMYEALMENLKQTFPSLTWDVSGKMDYYTIFKVERIEAQYYVLSAAAGFEMDIDSNWGMTYQGEQVSLSISMTGAGKMNGAFYYTRDELALARINMKMDFDANFTSGERGEKMSGSAHMAYDATATNDPPLDIFDFPIAVGEQWNAETESRITGTMKTKFEVAGREQTFSQTLDNTHSWSISASCPGTVNMKLPDGSTTKCYKILVSYTMIPGIWASPFTMGNVLYYSPDQRFIVASEISFDEVMRSASVGTENALPTFDYTKETGQTFTLSSVTEQEAREAIAMMGLEEKEEMNVIIPAIVAVVAGVIAAVVFAAKRRRA